MRHQKSKQYHPRIIRNCNKHNYSRTGEGYGIKVFDRQKAFWRQRDTNEIAEFI